MFKSRYKLENVMQGYAEVADVELDKLVGIVVLDAVYFTDLEHDMIRSLPRWFAKSHSGNVHFAVVGRVTGYNKREDALLALVEDYEERM